jgi:uncharacterized membrane protein YhiD involved in acid resistance
MDTLDIALRLSAAALAGVALGLNRDLHGKPTGVRTLGLVGVGSALAVLAVNGGQRRKRVRFSGMWYNSVSGIPPAIVA